MSNTDISRYFNRELSWLEFNQRVLNEACETTVPLLERLKFLAITSSNLDEFFMVRVGGLQSLVEHGVTKRDPSGMTPEEQLEATCRRTHHMVDAQYSCFMHDLEPALEQEGMVRIHPGALTDELSRSLVRIFERDIFSILTPQAVASIEQFPLLANRSLNICVRLEGEAGPGADDQFAVIPLGKVADRFVRLATEDKYTYILLEDVIGLFSDLFFPGRKVVECVPFRITRNADMSVREDMASDLLSEMMDVLDDRKRSTCVRLELAEASSQMTLDYLQAALEVDDRYIYSIPGPVDLSAFMQLAGTTRFDHLHYESWGPQASPDVDGALPMMENIAQNDLLLSHPYESFEPVVRFIEEAAEDPDVLAIKQTLYRTSKQSPIVAALVRAARNGKQVTALVELKARFDEARNIEWATRLEEEGVQVIYGVKGLKTHSKICVVVRREDGGIRRYCHFGTGNYNESTAKVYSDISYFTCNPDLGADATSFFNAISGYSEPQSYRRIASAPHNLREKVVECIENEVERKRQGQEALIWAKLNSLVDPTIIDALYAASKEGVEIRLNVRGICGLRPGVRSLGSENITVTSIIDRYLEHSRILYFHHGGDPQVWISSADWMPRNLDRRVELLVPVQDERSKAKLLALLETTFKDTLKASILLPDGRYQKRSESEDHALRSQEIFYQDACAAAKEADLQRRTSAFEPYRPVDPVSKP